MSAVSSLGVVAAIVLGTIAFALSSTRRTHATPQDYIVGGRGFGSVFLWVLLAGEIYTSFTFLGAAGWTYGYGAPAFYIMAYGTVGYILGYFLLPKLWQLGRDRGLLTAPDFFAARYESKALTTFASFVHIAAIVPYVTLQLSALQIFLTIAGYGSIDARAGAIVAFLLILAFVFITGLRGTAWASIVKDALVLGALVFLGVTIPLHFFGSQAQMFGQLRLAHAHLTLDGLTTPKGSLWFVSTVLLSGIGFFMGPQSSAAVFSARDGNALRRNAVFLPVYQLIMLLVFFAGFSAFLVAPGLHGAAVDQSFLVLVQRYYPAWVLGFVCAAGALCALVPSTALLLSVGSIAAKNIGSEVFGIARDDARRLMLTRVMVVTIGLLALGLWLAYSSTLVTLLLVYYNAISQFAPAYFLGFFWPRVTTAGVATGLVSGIVLALIFVAFKIAPFGLNPGFVALCVNAALAVIISLSTRKNEPAGAAGS